MIPPPFLQELLARTDIVTVVGRHVELKKAGINHKGLCPFHGEKTPSFTVSPSRQTYHCFGCGAHGNAIGFLMEHAGLGFIDAVHELAGEVGLAVPEDERSADERERAKAARERQATLAEVLAKAAAHYRKQLKESARAIDYLKGRGLTGAIAARFGLGYAPDAWRGLASVFARYDDPLLDESGLVIARDEADGAEAKRYDRFRDRVMFPIRGLQGDVIGFGGRIIDPSEPQRSCGEDASAKPVMAQPKYLNSPETPLFVKGRELYGLFEARAALRERGFALVVEGYMDVVALAQHGFANAVATLGTACTAEHVAKLFRFTDSVVFSFDGDAAGQRAAARALEAALPHAGDMRSVRFLFLPGEHDPDSFIRERGAEAFARRVADAIPLSRQLLVQAADGCDLETAEGRARALAQARPLWAALPAGVLKRQLLGELARMAALSDAELARMWGTGGVSARPPRRVAPTARSERFKAERLPADRAAWLLLVENGWWERLAAADHELLCALPGWHGELFRMLDRIHAEQGPLPWAALRAAFGGEWPAAVELVDAADPALEPLIDDLLGALRQLREAPKRAEADRLLGRTF